ncbi:hypothetical protein Hden_2969 [Hyphomicrobium denitrificans ATCC 51888]|uniref:Phage major tail protein, TP901-1 family n=1 Tax=Hyphomicrobium denitrificans (strain ATCC 51888 / DSM 1869 / NCIMB 11706 / TK 0415) TaxID=582899 RepID=D8JVB0_HYPDA|nr:hypothetical protein [Hyphomicrobium denitrificans]ADJ24764.1 hypothetical protein Hden_2969 [Hyphomicrobium denitrificans ATCC 51888]
MTAQHHATMGTKIYIGTTAATASTDTYKEIEGAKALSNAFGVSFASLDVTALSDLWKQTEKGLGDAGSLQVGGMVKTDQATGELAAGQAALEAASLDRSDDNIYNIKIVRLNGSGYYMKVRVMTFLRTFGQNTNTEDFTSSLMQQSLATPFPAPGG